MATGKTPYPHWARSYVNTNTTGRVLFVDSTKTNASDGNLGDSPDRALATIEGAFNHTDLAASEGSIIAVAPGHTETVTAAAGIVADIAGVTVRGHGNGRNRPTINFTTAATADIDIGAANITFENLYFDLTGVDAVAAAIDVNAADFTMKNCEVLMADGSGQAVVAVLGATAADRMKVHDCTFRAPNAGANAAVRITGTSDGNEVVDCHIYGDFADACVHNPTSNTSTNVVIRGNYLQNDQAGDHAIELVSAVTGVIADNILTNDTYALALDPGSCTMFGNRWSDSAVDTGDIPVPAPGVDAVTAGALPLTFSTGERFFVDSGHTDASDTAGYGTSPSAPFLTIDFANTQCTSANGDVIYAMPGHVDSVANGTDLNFDVIGVQVIGLGTGRNRPLIDFITADTADAPVSAANVLLKNLRFAAVTFDSNTAMITVSAADVTIEDCEFEMADSGQQTDSCITTNSARTRIFNCNFIGSSSGNQEDAIENTGTADGMEIIGCTFTGAFSNAAIQSATVHTNCIIRDNLIENLDTGQHAIQFSDAATGYIVDNKLVTDVAATALDKGSCKTHGNLFWDFDNVAVDGEFIPLSGAAHAAMSLNSYDPMFGYYLESADVQTPNSSSLDLFTVTGGKVMITLMLGTIGTVIEAGANNCSIEFNPSGSATNTVLNSVKDIDGFDSGVVLLADMAGGAVQGLDAGEGVTTGGGFAIVEAGGIEVKQAATKTGTYVWQLWYKPIDEGATVTVT